MLEKLIVEEYLIFKMLGVIYVNKKMRRLLLKHIEFIKKT